MRDFVKRKKRRYWIIAGLVCILASIGYFYIGIAAPSFEQAHQLKKMIRTHDEAEIKKISADKGTEKILLGLSKKTKVIGSDFQGGGPVGDGVTIGYFPASIGGQDFCTYMWRQTGFEFIPHWTLIKISLKPVSVFSIWESEHNTKINKVEGY